MYRNPETHQIFSDDLLKLSLLFRLFSTKVFPNPRTPGSVYEEKNVTVILFCTLRKLSLPVGMCMVRMVRKNFRNERFLFRLCLFRKI